MSTTMMLIILITCIILICLAFIANEQRQQARKLKDLFNDFSERASGHNMMLTSQGFFPDCTLGLDAPRRLLLVVDRSVMPANETVIDLSQVKRCVAKHHFSRSYERHASDLEPVERCSLVFHFIDGRRAEIFFNNSGQQMRELSDVSAMTMKWASILSKLLPVNESDDGGNMRIAV